MAALVFGEGPLTPANGFHSQADVVIDARLAADLLRDPDGPPRGRAAEFDTGEGVGRADQQRQAPSGQVDRANPRPENEFGHIIEMTPPDGDHAAHVFRWDVLIRCGDPRVAAVEAVWHPETSEHGWFASPDNCAVDAQGRLWVTTDQGKNWAKSGKADGLYAVETDGVKRGLSRLFFRAPVGAELCGPCFTPDGETVFLAVQHPGTDGVKDWKPFGRNSTFEDPATRWPDFRPTCRPAPRSSPCARGAEARSRCDRFAAGSDRRLAARVGTAEWDR